MMSRKLLATVALCTVGLWPEYADACTCAGSGLPCDAAWRADAVFVGHVVSIESSSMGGRLVQLAVVEAFRGFQLSQVTLVTGYGQGDCGYPFRMGESYVVYVQRSPTGQLSTSICTRTQPVVNASDDLTYLRSLAAIRPGDLARVAGRVQLWEWPRRTDRELRPLPGITVTATGEARTFSARADDRGEFELTGLPLGKYEIVARAPQGYEGVRRSLEVHDPRGCGAPVLYVRYDGRVIGRVVDGRGGGIRGLPLELVPTADLDKDGGSSNRVQVWTATEGTFELRLVAPGDYLLGFNSIRAHDGHLTSPRAFYPGVAEPPGAATIVVSAGERVRLRDFVIPDSIRLVGIHGVVVDEGGRPVRDASIALRDNTEGPNIIGPRFVTGDDGRFAFAVVDGGKYDVHVTRYVGSDLPTREVQVAMLPFTASAGTPVLTVVVKPSRY
jgi:Carboxypeptidase regulatory-like domain